MLGVGVAKILSSNLSYPTQKKSVYDVRFAFHSDSRCNDRSSTLSPELYSFGLGFGGGGVWGSDLVPEDSSSECLNP